MRVSTLAILSVVLGGTQLAAADQAGELIKRGVEQYKSGKYTEAASTLQKAYALDHKPETLFALAQAERLDGHCDLAIEHYRDILSLVSDLDIAKLVEQAVQLCPAEVPDPAPLPEVIAPPIAPPGPPRVVTRTVVEHVHHTDKLALTAAALGAAALGGSVGLLVASHANRDAAHSAFTVEDFNDYQHRADTQRTAAVVAGSAGVVLIGVAAWRLLRGGDRGSSDVVVAPMSGGASVSVVRAF